MKRRMSLLATLACATALLALAAFVATAKAEPPSLSRVDFSCYRHFRMVATLMA